MHSGASGACHRAPCFNWRKDQEAPDFADAQPKRPRAKSAHCARRVPIAHDPEGNTVASPDALYLGEEHRPPFLITSFAEGSTSVDADHLEAFCRRLAASLYNIHSINLSQYDLSFLPHIDHAITWYQTPQVSEQQMIHVAMQRATPLVDPNASALLHGDFWPGNLLWIGDELSAIIDWEDAMLGDPLADLGKSRLEILWALGPDAMNVYSAHYLALNRMLNATALPFWDLWGATRLSHYPSFAPKPDMIPRMHTPYEAFVAGAIRRLEAR